MATTKAINVAQLFANAAQLLYAARIAIQVANDEFVKAGISYVAGDFTNTTLAYIDPVNDMPTLITRLATDYANWFDAGSATTASPTAANADILKKCQPGTPLSKLPSLGL